MVFKSNLELTDFKTHGPYENQPSSWMGHPFEIKFYFTLLHVVFIW